MGNIYVDICGILFNTYTSGKKETVHYLIYEKTFKNYNEQILFFVILLTHVFVTTSHNTLMSTSNNVNFSTLESHCYLKLN